jgi:hypothetical protein
MDASLFFIGVAATVMALLTAVVIVSFIEYPINNNPPVNPA